MAWEPWTGCKRISDGCKYCYYYGPYSKRYGQNEVVKTSDFYKPIEKIYMPRKKIEKYKMPGGKICNTCFTTDFFIPEADEWRAEVWSIIKQRPDLTFLFLTKRIDRFNVSLPDDWGDGYDNVRIGCTVENQEMADYRLPLYISYPIKHKWIVCSPLLEELDLTPYLHGVDNVRVSGESGREARILDYDWVMSIRKQCIDAGISFYFDGTGSRFKQDGVIKKINPYKQRSIAREFGIDIEIDTNYKN